MDGSRILIPDGNLSLPSTLSHVYIVFIFVHTSLNIQLLLLSQYHLDQEKTTTFIKKGGILVILKWRYNVICVCAHVVVYIKNVYTFNIQDMHMVG